MKQKEDKSPIERVMERLAKEASWQWDYIRIEGNKWLLRATYKGKPVEVLVPFRTTDKVIRNTIMQVQKYYKFVGIN